MKKLKQYLITRSYWLWFSVCCRPLHLLCINQSCSQNHTTCNATERHYKLCVCVFSHLIRRSGWDRWCFTVFFCLLLGHVAFDLTRKRNVFNCVDLEIGEVKRKEKKIQTRVWLNKTNHCALFFRLILILGCLCIFGIFLKQEHEY